MNVQTHLQNVVKFKKESEDKLCRDLEEARAEAALAAVASEEADIAAALVGHITMDLTDFGGRADPFSEAFITVPITMAAEVVLED